MNLERLTTLLRRFEAAADGHGLEGYVFPESGDALCSLSDIIEALRDLQLHQEDNVFNGGKMGPTEEEARQWER